MDYGAALGKPFHNGDDSRTSMKRWHFFMIIICPVDLAEKDSLALVAAVNLSEFCF